MIYDRFGRAFDFIQESNKQVDDFEHMKQVAKELFDTWSHFKYGIPKNGEIIDIPPGDYFEKHYKFLTPDQFEKYGGGVCWDYVEWGDRFLREKDVNVRKFYIWTETPPNWETHTFLVIDCGDMNRYVYIESSFKLLEGVWIHNSIDEIIDTITWNMFKSKDNERRFDQFRYVVFEYTDSHPEYGCTSKQYMQWMADHGKVIKEGYAKKDTPPAGVVQEAKLSTDDRNDLEDNQFGIPELRKYPLTDEKHVLQAVRFFNKAPDEYKEELARNIVKRAKQLDMEWENWESLKPYLEKNVQEGAWQDIKNGVNPHSKKLYFHVSRDDNLDGKTLKPRVPNYLTQQEEFDRDKDPYFEETKTPRVCFSNSIEGCLNAMISAGDRVATGGDELYVYVPVKPISQYKTKLTKDLVKDKDVFDAKSTGEIWVLEPVQLRLYGTIMIDQLSNHKLVPTANKSGKVSRITYKWHWQVKPDVIKKMNVDVGYFSTDYHKNKQSEAKPVKEGYAVSESYRNIQSFLEGNYDIFQEADADTKKKTNDDLDDDEDEEIENEKPSDDTSDKSEDDVSDNVGDDDDLDLSDFGNNGGDDLPNNEYDPKEVETLNALIASEAAALSEYMDAAKASHVDVLQRLYSDIGDEERFHMEQLLFAKSELTGEEYIPRDKDVKKEYEELLAMGMDEESAMATAVDKVGVRVKVEENMEDMDADAESIEKDVEMLEAAVFNAELLMTILEQAEEDRDQTLMNQIAVFTESFYQQEAVMNAGEAPKEVTAPFNPITALIKLLMQVGSLLASLIHKFKQWIVKTKVRRAEMKRWFDNHGWEGFFSKGVSLYIWDDITGFQFDQMAAYINGLFIVAKDCGREAKLGNKYMEVFNEMAIPFDTKVYNVRNLPNREQVLRDLQALTLTTTKVVVNKNNQEQIINEWFGYTDETMISKYHPKNGDTYLKQSKNAYNKLAYLLDAAQFYNNKTSDMMKGYQEQNGVNDKNSLWYTNRKAYNDNYAALKAVVKGYSTLSKCFTHDLKWMMWLINDGTYQQTEQSDKADPDSRPMDMHPRAIFKDKQ